MATFKLGALMTDLVGSVGGTTFKRNGTTKIMMNKSAGASYNSLLQNKQLGALKFLFQQWSLLDDATKLAWNATALLYQFPDKFGDLRNLTGRQLFTKLNAQLIPVNSTRYDPAAISSTVPDFTVTDATISTEGFQVLVGYVPTEASAYACVQAEISQKGFNKPTFTRREVIAFNYAYGPSVVDCTEAFAKKFPFYLTSWIESTDPWTNRYEVRFYVFLMNEFGFRSPAKEIIMTIITA